MTDANTAVGEADRGTVTALLAGKINALTNVISARASMQMYRRNFAFVGKFSMYYFTLRIWK